MRGLVSLLDLECPGCGGGPRVHSASLGVAPAAPPHGVAAVRVSGASPYLALPCVGMRMRVRASPAACVSSCWRRVGSNVATLMITLAWYSGAHSDALSLVAS